MEFTFRTEYSTIVFELLWKEGIKQYAEESTFHQGTSLLRFQDDTLYRELTQWAAHAFACGLIERPEIERR